MIDLERMKLNKFQRMGLSIKDFFCNIPQKFKKLFTEKVPALGNKFKKVVSKEATLYKSVVKDGDWKTKLSSLIMGFGQFTRGQVLRGLMYLGFEIVFILYMVLFGWKYLSLLGSLGVVESYEVWDDATQLFITVYGDNSMLILLYSCLTIFVIASFILTWRANLKDNITSQLMCDIGHKPETNKDDVNKLINKQFHKTLLAVPTLGLFAFTIMPLLFMVLIAFTNYDRLHLPPKDLFDWVGLQNFFTLFGGQSEITSELFFFTFRQILLWTFIWALFATFSNYFLGMLVAIIINKKGIKFKKLWRSILIFTVAVPSFVSLLLMSQVFADEGILNVLLRKFNIISQNIPWLNNTTLARITIILVNIWIGIPYTMLICTGILMNIPADLYESAKIDGASPVRMYLRITLPYMLFVTGPYLISAFVGNLNNFNVIFLLSGGAPGNLNYQFAGTTDLLITWLYKLTVNESNFKLASVIGIVVFAISAIISLIFYSRSSSVKNEGDFQ